MENGGLLKVSLLIYYLSSLYNTNYIKDIIMIYNVEVFVLVFNSILNNIQY